MPVAVLTLGVIVIAPKGRHVRRTLTWTVPMLLVGGFFYVRNLFIVGNPVPAFTARLGPVSLPSPSSGVEEVAPIAVLPKRQLWHSIFVPGTRDAFGPVWWLVLALVAAGVVLAVCATRDAFVRILGCVAGAALAAYLVTPASIGTRRLPIEFKFSLRYAAAGVVLALVSLALMARHPASRWFVLSVLGAVIALTQLDPAIWPTDLRDSRFSEPVHGGAPIVGIVIGGAVLVVGVVLLLRGGARYRPSVAVVAIAGLAIVGVGAAVHHEYVRNRYQHASYLRATYRWARGVHHQRIALVGTPLQYPLYGADLSNFVQYIGRRGAHGSFAAITTCAEWRRALERGRYDYVLTAPNPLLPTTPIEEVWTRSDPAATVVLREGDATVFRLDGRLDPGGCRQLGPRASVRARSSS